MQEALEVINNNSTTAIIALSACFIVYMVIKYNRNLHLNAGIFEIVI